MEAERQQDRKERQHSEKLEVFLQSLALLMSDEENVFFRVGPFATRLQIDLQHLSTLLSWRLFHLHKINWKLHTVRKM